MTGVKSAAAARCHIERMKRGCVLCAALLAGCGDPETAAPADLGTASDGATLADLAPAPDFALTGPSLLSQTGLYADFGARTLAPGLTTWAPRYPVWSDGAVAERWLLLPDGARVDTSDMDQWVFPVGTRMWKQFTLDGRLMETRLLWKQHEGIDGWFGMAYLWREDGSDADAVPAGAEDPFGIAYDVPSQVECPECHGNARDYPISPSALQLSSADGHSGDLTAWAAKQLLSDPPATELQPPGQGVVQDALGYLHGNCGYCHNDDWRIGALVHLRTRLAVGETDPTRSAAYRTAIGVRENHDMPSVGRIGIVPGDPDHSQLWARLGHRDDGWEMPPHCSVRVDDAGVQLVRDWILGLQ